MASFYVFRLTQMNTYYSGTAGSQMLLNSTEGSPLDSGKDPRLPELLSCIFIHILEFQGLSYILPSNLTYGHSPQKEDCSPKFSPV